MVPAAGDARTTRQGSAPPPAGDRKFSAVLPRETAASVPAEAKAAVLASADRLLRGEWEVLGVVRTDMVRPDWFRDPVTGRRSASRPLRLSCRSPLGGAGRQRQAGLGDLAHAAPHAAGHRLVPYLMRRSTRTGWPSTSAPGGEENPFLSGVHWTSGIELGVRLISLAWIRRLLDDWPGVADLFERDGLALRQIHWHQQYLAAFPSRGSSANNHVIAEAAGQLVASCAFPWFPESERWRRKSARCSNESSSATLSRQASAASLPRTTSASSPNSGFSRPLKLRRAATRSAPSPGNGCARWPTARRPWSMSACARLGRAIPTKAGRCCSTLRRPTAGRRCWRSPMRWSAGSTGGPGRPRMRAARIVGALAGAKRHIEGRPSQRPSRFADAGTTLLRTTGENEIWCRCDGGPHGYLSIAAHAHADALSVEVRYAGVDILADPGTYCYHGERAWRSYFRSTIAHNTAELGGRSQSSEGGPFMWVRHARAREVEVIDDGDIARWTAEHDGYASLDPPALHRRSVLLDRASRSIDIIDEIEGGSHDIRLAFHLGPEVQVELDGVLRRPELACRSRTRGGAAGTAARAAVEPAPR